MLEPSLMDANPNMGTPGLRADQVVHGLEAQAETFLGFISCPAGPFFSGGHCRHRNVARLKFLPKCCGSLRRSRRNKWRRVSSHKFLRSIRETLPVATLTVYNLRDSLLDP